MLCVDNRVLLFRLRMPAMTEAPHIVYPQCGATHRVQSADLGSATDCGKCHQRLFAGAPLELERRVRMAKLDTEAHPQVAAPYGIRSIPTMVLFHGGREVARISGAMGAADIVRWVRMAAA